MIPRIIFILESTQAEKHSLKRISIIPVDCWCGQTCGLNCRYMVVKRFQTAVANDLPKNKRDENHHGPPVYPIYSILILMYFFVNAYVLVFYSLMMTDNKEER